VSGGVKGYQWPAQPGLAPVVRTVQEVTGAYSARGNRVMAKLWVLDYEFASHGVCRVKSARAAWRPRGPRTAHLYPPGVAYWEDAREERGVRHSGWFCFDGGEACGLARMVDPAKGYMRFEDREGAMGRLIQEAAEAGRRLGADGFWRAQALLCMAVDLMVSAERVDAETCVIRPEGGAPKMSALVAQTAQYLRDHLSGRVTLEDLARRAHVSVSTLSHRYREETGETPMTTLAKLRVMQAKALMQRGLPLKAIAGRLGFVDAFHLSKTFKRVEGVSPRKAMG